MNDMHEHSNLNGTAELRPIDDYTKEVFDPPKRDMKAK